MKTVRPIAARLPLAQRLPPQLSVGPCVPLRRAGAHHQPGVNRSAMGLPQWAAALVDWRLWRRWFQRWDAGRLGRLQGLLGVPSECGSDEVSHRKAFSHHATLPGQNASS
jgi:hypothetical protein